MRAHAHTHIVYSERILKEPRRNCYSLSPHWVKCKTFLGSRLGVEQRKLTKKPNLVYRKFVGFTDLHACLDYSPMHTYLELCHI